MMQMETYIMFLDWKSQHCQNYGIQVIYRFNAMSIKLSIALFSQNQNKIFYNLHGKTKDPKEPGKPEKEKQI